LLISLTRLECFVDINQTGQKARQGFSRPRRRNKQV